MQTERVYLMWIRRLILFHGKRHPVELGKSDIEAFLSHLAVNRKVSPSTQNQALQAILFLYRNVLEVKLPWLDSVIRAKPKKRIPVVLSSPEVARLLEKVSPPHYLAASLMYGSGLRLMECLRLRVGDLDEQRHTIRVFAGKGGKDRMTVLPRPRKRPVFASRLPVIHCGIHLRLTCWNPEPIFALFSNYWGTVT